MGSNKMSTKYEPYNSTQIFSSQQEEHHHHHNQNQNQTFHDLILSFSSSPSVAHGSFNTISNKDGGAYDLGELDQALFLYLEGQDQSTQDQRENLGGMMRPQHTLNIFPSEPMHVVVEPSSKANTTGLVCSKGQSEPSMGLSNPRSNGINSASLPDQAKAVKGNRKGPTTSSSEQDGPKTPDPKTLRRLAQNREAAKKSRLRKKAYVQQLESSRLRLAQLEQEIQRARSQGFYLGVAGDHSAPLAMGNLTSDAALFDMEYARWLEENHRLMAELRRAVQEHLQENELRVLVDHLLAQYEQVMALKSMIAKSDIFHLFSGMWKTPAERCFMWIGGFRPSEIIKIILKEIEPLTEQQMAGICDLQQSTQEAEEALSQGLEALTQTLTQTIIADSLNNNVPSNMNNYMAHMALAVNKLSTLEGFVRQGDHLRHQSLHRLNQILTTRQAARCFLAIGEYFNRLRALSSLWLTRPREA
ncbi:bZIP transcription factor family protein [Striga hermonthica]|uniref:BZIP transcription factor family protein n=1 Tax=Striga hermonthica TaxID=68872 RepID=A0A9N7RGF0_STRHE|nr:bZIP transcription factor family protein [Striga hermonthica]